MYKIKAPHFVPDKYRSIIQIDANKNRGLKEKQCSKNFKRMIFHRTNWGSWQALHHSEPTRRSRSNHHHEDSKAENQTEICVFVSANPLSKNQEKIWGISGTSRLSTDLATEKLLSAFRRQGRGKYTDLRYKLLEPGSKSPVWNINSHTLICTHDWRTCFLQSQPIDTGITEGSIVLPINHYPPVPPWHPPLPLLMLTTCCKHDAQVQPTLITACSKKFKEIQRLCS